MIEQPPKNSGFLSLFAGFLVITQGVLLFVGLEFNITAFTSVFPGLIQMNIVTAVCFILCGVSVLLLSLKKSAIKTIILYFSLVSVISVGCFRFIELSFSDFSYTERLFNIQGNSIMAPNTAFLFIILGLSFLFLSSPRKNYIFISHVLLLLTFFLAMLALTGYIYGISSFYALSRIYPMALNTAFLFVIVSVGSLYIKSDEGLVKIITSDVSGGSTARRLIPIIVLLPLLLGWLMIHGEKVLLFDRETGVALFVVIVIAILFIMILVNSYLLNKEELSRKEIEKEVRDTHNRLDAIVDNSPAAIYIKDLNDRFIMVNKQTELNHKLPKDKILGKTLTDLFPGFPGDVEMYEKNDREVILARKPLEFEEQAMLEDGIHTYLSLKFPLFDENNEPYASCGISSDITDRKRSEKKFVSILESAPDAIIIVDENGKINLLNKQAEKLFGYSKKELEGNLIEMLIPEHLRAHHTGHRDGFIRDHSVRPMGSGLELYGRKKDSTLFPVEISLSPIDIEGGILVSAAIRDITQRKIAEVKLKELNLKLEESNKELESFSYSVSHDLRAPIRHVIGFGEKLKKQLAEKAGDEERRLLDKISNSSVKMGRLVDDLLMFSRVGRTDLVKTDVNMYNIFNEVISEGSYDEADIEFNVQDLLMAKADPFQLKIVAGNLISNAVKYTSKKDERIINVSSFEENSMIVYSVTDNGTGFDMRYADKLFGVFQRLHSETDFEGTGIGLAIVSRIISKHGGNTWAEGKPGEGATFYFSIPIKQK